MSSLFGDTITFSKINKKSIFSNNELKSNLSNLNQSSKKLTPNKSKSTNKLKEESIITHNNKISEYVTTNQKHFSPSKDKTFENFFENFEKEENNERSEKLFEASLDPNVKFKVYTGKTRDKSNENNKTNYKEGIKETKQHKKPKQMLKPIKIELDLKKSFHLKLNVLQTANKILNNILQLNSDGLANQINNDLKFLQIFKTPGGNHSINSKSEILDDCFKSNLDQYQYDKSDIHKHESDFINTKTERIKDHLVNQLQELNSNVIAGKSSNSLNLYDVTSGNSYSPCHLPRVQKNPLFDHVESKYFDQFKDTYVPELVWKGHRYSLGENAQFDLLRMHEKDELKRRNSCIKSRITVTKGNYFTNKSLEEEFNKLSEDMKKKTLTIGKIPKVKIIESNKFSKRNMSVDFLNKYPRFQK